MTNRFGLIDFDRFHRIELPDKLADGPLPDLGSLRPIAFRLKGGSAFTYAPRGSSIDILPGEDGASTPVDSTSVGRRALYMTYVQPAAFDVVGPGQGYNDVVFARDSGHVPHAREMD